MVPTGCEITIPRSPGITRIPSPAPLRKAAALRQAWKFTRGGSELLEVNTPLRREAGVPRTPAAIAPEPGAANSPSMAQQTTSVVEMIRRIIQMLSDCFRDRSICRLLNLLVGRGRLGRLEQPLREHDHDQVFGRVHQPGRPVPAGPAEHAVVQHRLAVPPGLAGEEARPEPAVGLLRLGELVAGHRRHRVARQYS